MTDQIIFIPRTRPRDGETTVLKVPGELVTLLSAGMTVMRDLRAGGTAAPLASVMHEGGHIDSESLTVEGIRASYSPDAIVNYYVPRLRRALAADAIVVGVFCYASFQADALRVTDEPDAESSLIAWIAHRDGQVFEVIIPFEIDGSYGSPTAERIPRLPVFVDFRILSIIQAEDGAGAVSACAVGPDSETAMLIDRNGEVRHWDLRRQESLETGAIAGGRPTVSALNAVTRRYLAGYPDGSLALRSLADAAGGTLSRPAQAVTACALSADGKWALTGGTPNVVALWNIEAEPRVARAWQTEQADVRAAALNGDGTIAITGSSDGTMAVWHLTSGQRGRLLGGGDGPVMACALGPDGQFALTSYDGLATLWDIEDGTEVRTLSMKGHVAALAFAPDRRYALFGHDNGDLTFVQFLPG